MQCQVIPIYEVDRKREPTHELKIPFPCLLTGGNSLLENQGIPALVNENRLSNRLSVLSS